MNQVHIRPVSLEDSAQILNIYASFIRDTTITFEYEVPSLEEFTKRVDSISSHFPYIVAEVNGEIAGYAYSHTLRERAAYQWDAELSIYVSDAYQKLGLGKLLYGAIIELSKLQNIHTVYGCVTAPNPKSDRLHAYFGFEKVGVYHNTGYKHGGWHDVIWYEKQIKDYEIDPQPLISIQDVDQSELSSLLKRHEASYNANL